MTATEHFLAHRASVKAAAEAVVPHLIDLTHPASVLDVGCGHGEWINAFRNHGVFAVGVDLATTGHDLTQPLDLGQRFDLALCLEVGEHLPDHAADTLVESLAHHSDTIVFGAATPGQEGDGHINCQQHEYWHDLFAAHGYATYELAWLRQLGAVLPWYRNNTFLYRGEAF